MHLLNAARSSEFHWDLAAIKALNVITSGRSFVVCAKARAENDALDSSESKVASSSALALAQTTKLLPDVMTFKAFMAAKSQWNSLDRAAFNKCMTSRPQDCSGLIARMAKKPAPKKKSQPAKRVVKRVKAKAKKALKKAKKAAKKIAKKIAKKGAKKMAKKIGKKKLKKAKQAGKKEVKKAKTAAKKMKKEAKKAKAS
jgi:hypothetical protein